MGVFINFSNHQTSKWSIEQKNAAYALADTDHVVDMKFPKVPTDADSDEIERLAFEYVATMRELIGDEEGYVMVQGEASLSCAVVQMLNNPANYKITPVCATTERIAKEMPDGSINRKFEFVRFREYCNL